MKFQRQIFGFMDMLRFKKIVPKRREALRKRFGTIRAIREADVDTLAAVVPRNTAEAVYRHFHEKER